MRLVIDEGKIDDELRQQAELYRKVSRQHVYAVAEAATAKGNLKDVEAALMTSVRLREKTKDRLGSCSDKVMTSVVQTHSKRKAAFEKWIEAEREANDWQSLVKSFEQKGYSMKEFCSLVVAEHLAFDSVRGSSAKVTEARGDEIKKKRAAKRPPLKPKKRVKASRR